VGNRVEPASSSRSKCVVCAAPIGKGEARLAEEYSDISIPKLIVRFYHLKCAAAAQPELLHHALRDVRPGTIFDRADIEARLAPAIERVEQQRSANYQAKLAAAPPKPQVATDATTLAVLAELEARPDDADVLAIVADQLMAQGDPRGELIAVQRSLAKIDRRLPSRDRDDDDDDDTHAAAATADRLAKRFEELSTQLAVGELDKGDRAIWGIGFVRRLELVNKSATRLAELVPLWNHPSLRIVTELKLAFRAAGDASAMEVLAGAIRPTLRRLEIGHNPEWVLEPLQPLLDALPQLRAVRLDGRLRERLAHPAIESVALGSAARLGDLAVSLTAITGDGLPALRELAIESFPALDGAPDDRRDDLDAIVLQLAAQGVLERLERLAIAGGRLSDRGIAALAAELDGRKLARLDLSKLPMPRSARPQLAALCVELAFTDNEPRDDAELWVEHANQPSWGRGTIVRRFDGKLEIMFPKLGKKVFRADAPFLRFG
jgi:Protein of unknown function (DUF3553)